MESIDEEFFYEYDWWRLDYVIEEDREQLRQNYEREQRKGLPQHLACPQDSPACTDLLYDPAGVLSNRERWPTHLCGGPFLRESTERWIHRSGIIMAAGFDTWASEHPLPVGRESVKRLRTFDEDSSGRLVEKPPANAAHLQNVVPLDGEEKALWALRIEKEGCVLDLFGLAEYQTKEHREKGKATMGELAYVMRGREESLRDFLQAARRWWSRFRGLPIGGRPVNTGMWTSGDEFKEALQTAIRGLRSQRRKVTQEEVAAFFADRPGFPVCDDSQLRRWLRQYGLSWKDLLRES